MKLPKSIKLKSDQQSFSQGTRFIFRHGEKLVAVIVILAAMGIGVRTLDFQPLSWQPDELEELANSAEETIKENGFRIEDETIRIFDYAGYAEQIKQAIPTEPYRSETVWKPVLQPDPLLRGGFEVLTAESFRGEAVRRTNATVALWERPTLPEMKKEETSPGMPSIWVNLYGTIPKEKQETIYRQVFKSFVVTGSLTEYLYYELERSEITPTREPVWQPVIVYPNEEFQTEQVNAYPSDYTKDRLVPFTGQQDTNGDSMLLFSDCEVEPAKTYAYRIRLYLTNPNYNVQETSVEAGVDTKSPLIRSEWSSLVWVYVPDRTLVRLASVTPTDSADFPRQAVPLRALTGTLILDYFDIELGQTLPPVEKTEVRRGMLANMTKTEANRYFNRGKNPDEMVSINYPDVGLRSDVCIMDFSGGRKLQKRPTAPDLFVVGKALLLMPDGTMQVTTTAPELFK